MAREPVGHGTHNQPAPAHPVQGADAWSVCVENFGKIARAHIQDAPLLMLVGKNNTGKSYIATLLFGLMNPSLYLSQDISQKNWPSWFSDELKAGMVDGGEATVEIGPARRAEIARSLNSIFENDGPEFYERLFAFDGFSDSRVEISPSNARTTFRVSIAREPTTVRRKDRQDSIAYSARITINDMSGTVYTDATLPPSISSSEFALHFAFILLIESAILGDDNGRGSSAVYLPAARTGLMLAFKALVSQLIAGMNVSLEEESRTRLSLPVTMFLQTLNGNARGLRGASQFAGIADWVEQQLLDGKISIKSQENVATFDYRPANTNVDIPLHATSSMVSELAPFLTVLRSLYGPTTLVFEEPEAHLHLAAQRVMARAIARMLNVGMRVIVTTHSDTFVQQINNLMQIYHAADRDAVLRQLGYDSEDVIDPVKVRGYEFISGVSGTVTRELEKTKEGMIVPSLSETLVDLATETIQLNESL